MTETPSASDCSDVEDYCSDFDDEERTDNAYILFDLPSQNLIDIQRERNEHDQRLKHLRRIIEAKLKSEAEKEDAEMEKHRLEYERLQNHEYFENTSAALHFFQALLNSPPKSCPKHPMCTRIAHHPGECRIKDFAERKKHLKEKANKYGRCTKRGPNGEYCERWNLYPGKRNPDGTFQGSHPGLCRMSTPVAARHRDTGETSRQVVQAWPVNDV